MPYDPYAIMNRPLEYNPRGDAVNGYDGSQTSGSLRNAAMNTKPSTGGSNVFAEMVRYGKPKMAIQNKRLIAPPPVSLPAFGTAPASGAGNPFAPDAGRNVTYVDPRTGGTTTSNPNVGFGTGGYSVINAFPGSGNTYYDPSTGGTTHTDPNQKRDWLNMPPQTDGGRSDTYYDPRTGGTTTRNPGSNPFANPVRELWDAPPAPAGSTTPFGGGALPQAGTIQRYNPFANPTPDAMQDAEIRRTLQKPGTSMSATPEGGYQNMREDSPDQFGPGPFNPQPSPQPVNPFRPPAVPSTQPVANPRPPTVPSTQPVGGLTGTPERPSWEGPPAPPGSTTPFYGPKPGGGRYEDPPGMPVGSPVPGSSTTYYDPTTGGTTTHAPGGLPNPFAVQPPIGRSVGGMSPGLPSTPGAPGGQPFGAGGVGRRYGPGYGGTPIAAPGEQGAGGTAPTMYEWKDGKLVPVDAPPAETNVTTTPGAPGTPGTGSSTTTGQFGAPNNTTTFDPNVLPQSNVGDWLNPVLQDTMDRMTRQLRHEGSISGATNSGGFIPGMAEKLAPVANQFAALKGDIGFKDQQAKADRLLDKYKFDNTQQLTEWIKTHEFELQQAGIDANVLIGKYQADQQLAGAGLGASASMYGSDAAANASRNNAMLDYMQGMYGIGANYDLGQQRQGYDYWNSNNQYNLGLYGTDVDRENNMMNYLSRIYGLGPDYLRLMMGGDPTQLIPGMAPSNTVTIR